jgi:hypothetical protein
MAEETRSLWEVYDSEVELWRRGRVALVVIALFHFALQGLVIAAFEISGNVERLVWFGISVVFFWLLFYFVWIGVQWLRWVWGGWDLLSGFCFLIWAWRDESGVETVFGTAGLLIGFFLCFSPSIYFFAKRQRETVRWTESLLIAGACLLSLLSIGAVIIGLSAFRELQAQDACVFAQEVNQRIYMDRDFDWVQRHVTPASFQQNGRERLRYFFEANAKQLGQVSRISPARAQIRLQFKLPFNLRSDALVHSTAETNSGPVELHEILLDNGSTWQLDRMWWSYLPVDAKAAEQH